MVRAGKHAQIVLLHTHARGLSHAYADRNTLRKYYLYILRRKISISKHKKFCIFLQWASSCVEHISGYAIYGSKKCVRWILKWAEKLIFIRVSEFEFKFEMKKLKSQNVKIIFFECDENTKGRLEDLAIVCALLCVTRRVCVSIFPVRRLWHRALQTIASASF